MSEPPLYPVTMTLNEDEMLEAVRLLMAKRGLWVGDRGLSFSINHTPGDRPFDSDYTTFTIMGVYVQGPTPTGD